MSSKKTDEKISDLGEKGWIDRVRKRLGKSGAGVVAGIGDDACITRIKSPIISTTDLLIENIHFVLSIHPPRLLGRKALSVNLSDVAAMAGTPRFALLSLGLPPRLKRRYADEFLAGFIEVAEMFGVELVGGDTTAAERMTISVTVLAEAGGRGSVLRGGARTGDDIYVTGTLGDASLGLDILCRDRRAVKEISSHPHAPLLRRHLDPSPRVALGKDLAGTAHSMIDLSDGLATDLFHILEESGLNRKGSLSAKVDLSSIPLSRSFSRYFKISTQEPLPKRALRFALQGGEDYELLFTAGSSEKVRKALARLSGRHKVGITHIGRIAKDTKSRIIVLNRDGREMKIPSPVFEHFPRTGIGRRRRSRA